MTYGLATLAYVFLSVFLIQQGQYKKDNFWLFNAVIVSVIWGLTHAISSFAGPYTTNLNLLFLSNLTFFTDWLKGAVWVIFLFHHLSLIWNSQAKQKLSRIVGNSLIIMLVIGFIIEVVYIASLWGIFERGIIGNLPFYNMLLLSFSILFLIENLYRNIANENRWGIRLFCLGLGSIYAFDFLLFGDGLFYSLIDPELYQARGAMNFIIIPLLVVALKRKPKWSVGISLSRDAAFHMVSLIVGVIYLLAISGIGYYIKNQGGQWGNILQVSFLFAAFIGFVAIIYSGKIRSTILVWLNKYFFMYKFDYREEWLRFIGTITASEDHYNIQERAIKSVADIMDCRGGALWYRETPDRLSPIARWNFDHDLSEELLIQSPFIQYLEKHHWIVNLDDNVGGKIAKTDCQIPQLLLDKPDLWLVIPLINNQKITGFIILYKPRVDKELNWEIFDILKTVSLQIASYLAEQDNLKALAIASEFEEFNRKFAFVIHDIKNMASQLSLLQANAEKHGNNPEFQKDMKLTVKNTVEKMNNLLSRINIVQEPSLAKKNQEIDVITILEQGVDKFKKAQQNVELNTDISSLSVLSNAEDLDIIFMHIIQNALDTNATKDHDLSVNINVSQENDYAIINIEDYGEGMSYEFIRNELFRPFRSLKVGGYGIGAYESRQLIHNMDGRIEIKSREGAGTSVLIYLKKAG